jgi:biotin carboxylase
LAPILSHEHGLPSPSLESVLRCEHKYWSRREQAASIPECVPDFSVFDPFDDDALASIDVSYPFWVKPVKSFASQLGFRIEDPDDFAEALEEIRAEIGTLGSAFDEVLEMADLPDVIAEESGTSCLAEQIISGVQAAPEGAITRGRFEVHGVFDMIKDEAGKSFARLDYPSGLPEQVQKRMIDVSERFLRHIGFDDGCFNAEFMWDEEEHQLWVIEFNTRISQSHSDMFAKVDGRSNHEVAIDVALGQEPRRPDDGGRFRVATKGVIPHYEDGIVRRVPSDEDIEQLQERFPHTQVLIAVEPGDRLADLPNQDSYRYELGTLYIGATSREELVERYHACIEALPFEFDPVDA